LARGKDGNHGAGLHRARIEFSYFAGSAVRGNEPLRLKRTLFEQRFHRKTVRVVSGFSGSSRGRGIRKLRRSGKADRRHGSHLYLFHTPSFQSVLSPPPSNKRLPSPLIQNFKYKTILPAHNKKKKAKGVFMTGVIIALISGALMSVQGVFNTDVTKNTSLWVSTSFVQFSALAVCLVIWFFTDRQSFSTILEVPNKYSLLGGVIGAFITITVIKSMESLGPAKSAMLIVISQLVVAYAIELFGIFGVEKQPVDWRRVGGMIIAIIGVIIFKW